MTAFIPKKLKTKYPFPPKSFLNPRNTNPNTRERNCKIIERNPNPAERDGCEASWFFTRFTDLFIQCSNSWVTRTRYCPKQWVTKLDIILSCDILCFVFLNTELDYYFVRAVYPASSVTDLKAVDAALKATELQVQAIKDRLREETLAIPKAKVLHLLSDFSCLCFCS